MPIIVVLLAVLAFVFWGGEQDSTLISVLEDLPQIDVVEIENRVNEGLLGYLRGTPDELEPLGRTDVVGVRLQVDNVNLGPGLIRNLLLRLDSDNGLMDLAGVNKPNLIIQFGHATEGNRHTVQFSCSLRIDDSWLSLYNCESDDGIVLFTAEELQFRLSEDRSSLEIRLQLRAAQIE